VKQDVETFIRELVPDFVSEVDEDDYEKTVVNHFDGYYCVSYGVYDRVHRK